MGNPTALQPQQLCSAAAFLPPLWHWGPQCGVPTSPPGGIEAPWAIRPAQSQRLTALTPPPRPNSYAAPWPAPNPHGTDPLQSHLSPPNPQDPSWVP